MRPFSQTSSSDLLGDEAIQDPYPFYARLHDLADVHRLADSRFFLVSGWDAVNDAVTRTDDFSSNLTATIMRADDGSVGEFEIDALGGPTHVLATADDPDHAAHRKLLIPQLAAKHVRALDPFIAETFDHLWRQHLRGDRIEWMESVANRLPMMVVGQLIGVPAADLDQLARWGYAGTQLLEGLLGHDELTAAQLAITELAGYIDSGFAQAAVDPGDNLFGDLATACEAGELSSIAAQVMMITLFSAGGESTASLIGSAAHILVTRPDLQQQLRDQPELLVPFLEETLRYEPPFRGHYRHVLRDTSLGGVSLRAGDRLLLLWGAANRDPRQFERPDEFQLDRSGNKSHLSFGKGAHFCVGAALARLEAKLVIGDLLQRTRWIAAAEVGTWLPSLLVRRLARLELDITPALRNPAASA